MAKLKYFKRKVTNRKLYSEKNLGQINLEEIKIIKSKNLYDVAKEQNNRNELKHT
jgi:hypothetical protein